MITSCNPGSWLEVVGTFEFRDGYAMYDRETGEEVSLYVLLRTFAYDPNEQFTGRVKITITPAMTTIPTK